MRALILALVALGALTTVYVASTAAWPPATEWARSYGWPYSDCGYCVRQTSDGGYVIVGYTDFFGGPAPDVWLLKTNASGDTTWTRIYGGSGYEVGHWVEQTSDGGYAIVGSSMDSFEDDEDILLIRTDADGDTVWTRTYGGWGNDVGRCLKEVAGGYVLAGTTSSFGAGPHDILVLRIGADGDSLWMRTFGGTGADYGYSLELAGQGGLVVAGYTNSFGAGGYDIYLVKIDPSGNKIWARTYGGTANDVGLSVERSLSGYVVAGNTSSFGAGAMDAFLVGTDADGGALWTKTYGGSANDAAWSVEGAGNGYIIAGYTESYGAGQTDVYVLRTDPLGDTLWTKTYGSDWVDCGYCAQLAAPDSGYIIVGTVGHWEWGDDIWLIKMGDTPCSVEPRAEVAAPFEFRVEPNPFRGKTEIVLRDPAVRDVGIAVYDVRGGFVTDLTGTKEPDGHWTVNWDGTDWRGCLVPAGVYFCWVDSKVARARVKLILMR